MKFNLASFAFIAGRYDIAQSFADASLNGTRSTMLPEQRQIALNILHLSRARAIGNIHPDFFTNPLMEVGKECGVRHGVC